MRWAVRLLLLWAKLAAAGTGAASNGGSEGTLYRGRRTKPATRNEVVPLLSIHDGNIDSNT